jgi:hypothetical protein
VDPNGVLTELREIASRWEREDDTPADGKRAIELGSSLDGWLSAGGVLPDAWGPAVVYATAEQIKQMEKESLLPRRPMEVCARCDHKESLHIGTVCMGVGSCRCHQFKAAPNPVPALRSAVVYDENPMVQVWFLAICQSCEPRAAQPFRNYTDRDEWAAVHAAATNHSVLTPIEVKW